VWHHYPIRTSASLVTLFHPSLSCATFLQLTIRNRVHQCINLDGRYLNPVASKSKFVLQFLKNGNILFNFTLLWINFNELWSTRVPLIMPNECYRIPYAVQCICDAINTNHRKYSTNTKNLRKDRHRNLCKW
jgi:hypothetical protein